MIQRQWRHIKVDVADVWEKEKRAQDDKWHDELMKWKNREQHVALELVQRQEVFEKRIEGMVVLHKHLTSYWPFSAPMESPPYHYPYHDRCHYLHPLTQKDVREHENTSDGGSSRSAIRSRTHPQPSPPSSSSSSSTSPPPSSDPNAIPVVTTGAPMLARPQLDVPNQHAPSNPELESQPPPTAAPMAQAVAPAREPLVNPPVIVADPPLLSLTLARTDVMMLGEHAISKAEDATVPPIETRTSSVSCTSKGQERNDDDSTCVSMHENHHHCPLLAKAAMLVAAAPCSSPSAVPSSMTLMTALPSHLEAMTTSTCPTLTASQEAGRMALHRRQTSEMMQGTHETHERDNRVKSNETFVEHSLLHAMEAPRGSATPQVSHDVNAATIGHNVGPTSCVYGSDPAMMKKGALAEAELAKARVELRFKMEVCPT